VVKDEFGRVMLDITELDAGVFAPKASRLTVPRPPQRFTDRACREGEPNSSFDPLDEVLAAPAADGACVVPWIFAH